MNLTQKIAFFTANVITYFMTFYAYTEGLAETTKAIIVILMMIPLGVSGLTLYIVGDDDDKKRKSTGRRGVLPFGGSDKSD